MLSFKCDILALLRWFYFLGLSGLLFVKGSVNLCVAKRFLILCTVNGTVPFAIKLTLCLSFLILIRGCIPRYRYDFLTKLGWVKFLAYILALLCQIFLIYFGW